MREQAVDFAVCLIKVLHKHRLRQKLSLSEVARRSGIVIQALSRLERGRQPKIRVDTLFRICVAMNVCPGQIVSEAYKECNSPMQKWVNEA